MLNKDFYPTPKPLIEKMLEGVEIGRLSYILEPSAGKGDICDYLARRHKNTYYNRSKLNFDVIEIEPDLQLILKGKEYNLIHDDFLTFQSHKRYDLLVANFPFSDGEKHLAHALQMIEANGGQLICLVNAETLYNPCNQTRQALAQTLERLCGEIEFIEGAFSKAERPTDVEVALIRVSVEVKPKVSILFNNLREAEEIKLNEIVPEGIALAGFKSGLLACFQQEATLGVNLIKEWAALKPYIMDELQKAGQEKPSYAKPLIELKIGDYQTDSLAGLVNDYLKKLRQKYWSCLLRDNRFSRNYTNNILKELEAKLRDLVGFDFTEFNIRELEKDLFTKINGGIEDAILELFDTLSCQFHWRQESGNIHYYNGWATNKAHKINDKVIIPMNGYNAYDKTKVDYYLHETLADMVKVFNYLAADEINPRQLTQGALWAAEGNQKFNNIDLRYFTVTLYKKGTAHIRFQDKRLLEKLNIFGSQRKNWLPPAYGKKRYSEMNQEEREVVDTFQGKSVYEEIMRNADYYLVPQHSLYQLTESASPVQKPMEKEQAALWD